MALIPYYDPILDELRAKDTATIPDPLIVNNLSVNSLASINFLTSSSIVNYSTISTNLLNANQIIASTATLGYTHISTIDWNLTSGTTLTVEGQMNWNATAGTVVVGMPGGNVDLALGMETLFPKRVKNSTATLMPKGSVVYINGVDGNDPTVTFALATSDSTSAYTLGLTAEDISAGQKGWVTTYGEIVGVDLSSFAGGDTLYLSGATAGLFTNIKPQAPIHYVRLGTVVKATPDGILTVNVINGFEVDELHNVVITSLASGQILQSGVSSLWYNRSLASAIAENISFPSLGSLAVLDTLSHGSLTSLLNDDHTQYFKLDGRLTEQVVTQDFTTKNKINFSNASAIRTYSIESKTDGYFYIQSNISTTADRLYIDKFTNIYFRTNTGSTFADFTSSQTLLNTDLQANGANFLTLFAGDTGMYMQYNIFFDPFKVLFLIDKGSVADDAMSLALQSRRTDPSTFDPTDLDPGDRIGSVTFEAYNSLNLNYDTLARISGYVVTNSTTGVITFDATNSGTLAEVARLGDPSGNPSFALNSTSLNLAMLYLNQNNATNALPVVRIQQSDLSEEFIDFRATNATGNPVNTTALGTYYGRARIAVNGTFKWLALYN